MQQLFCKHENTLKSMGSYGFSEVVEILLVPGFRSNMSLFHRLMPKQLPSSCFSKRDILENVLVQFLHPYFLISECV